MGKVMNISIVVLAVIGIGLLIVSVGTNYWNSNKLKGSLGLWKICTRLGDISTCSDRYSKIQDVPKELAGVMATMVLAILFQGIGMIVGTAGAMMKKKLGGGVAVLHLLAVVSACAGLGMYTHYYGDMFFFPDFDWSYYLGWVGAAILFIELVLLIVTLAR